MKTLANASYTSSVAVQRQLPLKGKPNKFSNIA